MSTGSEKPYRRSAPSVSAVLLTIRQNEADPRLTGCLGGDIGGDQPVSFVVERQFGKHFAVLLNRIVIGFERSFAKDNVGWQNLAGPNQIVFLDLVMHISEVPEDQLGEIVPAPGCCREAQHVPRVKFGDGIGKRAARRAVAFVDDQVTDLRCHCFGAFVKGLNQGNGNFFADFFLAAADAADFLYRNFQEGFDAFGPLTGQIGGVHDDQCGLFALGQDVKGHDGLAGAGRGIQGAELFAQHMLNSLLLEGAQLPIKGIIHRRQTAPPVLDGIGDVEPAAGGDQLADEAAWNDKTAASEAVKEAQLFRNTAIPASHAGVFEVLGIGEFQPLNQQIIELRRDSG